MTTIEMKSPLGEQLTMHPLATDRYVVLSKVYLEITGEKLTTDNISDIEFVFPEFESSEQLIMIRGEKIGILTVETGNEYAPGAFADMAWISRVTFHPGRIEFMPEGEAKIMIGRLDS